MCGGDGIDLTTLAQRIGYLRRCAGLRRGEDLSHKDVAAALGVSAASVGAWEGVGKRMKGPHRNRIEAIAKFYSVDAGWLLTGRGEPPSGVRLKFAGTPGVPVSVKKGGQKEG